MLVYTECQKTAFTHGSKYSHYSSSKLIQCCVTDFCEFCHSTHHSSESKSWNAALASARPITASAETEMAARRAIEEVFMVGVSSRDGCLNRISLRYLYIRASLSLHDFCDVKDLVVRWSDPQTTY